MCEEQTRVQYWINLLGSTIRKQGILQQRGKGNWRLRWREEKNGKAVHRSMRIPVDEVELVRRIFEKVKYFRIRQREGKEIRKQARRELSECYKQRRQAYCDQVEGGRDNRRRAAKKFDELVKKYGLSDFCLGICMHMYCRSLPGPGRPRNPPPRY